MKRGIITSATEISKLPDGYVSIDFSQNRDLRYYSLYWDEVVIPANNILHIVVEEEDLLIGAGVLSRPKIEFLGSIGEGQFFDTLSKFQALAIKEKLRDEPETDWVIHQTGEEIFVPAEYSSLQHSIRMDISGLLPVPMDNVPFSEVLDYKYRRADELTALHNTLDELYMEILSSPDTDLSRKKVLIQLRSAISDLEKTSLEKWKSTNKYDFTVELNADFGKIAALTSVSTAAIYSTGSPHALVAGAVTALASMIKITAKKSLVFESTQNKLKLGYLVSARKEQLLY